MSDDPASVSASPYEEDRSPGSGVDSDGATHATERSIGRRAFLGVIGVGIAAAAVAAADAFLSPRGPAPVTAGTGTVTGLLATAHFSVAHRGCDRSWPEMSLYAYEKAVAVGFDALEISLARTADGVWFGLHDDTLDRTSGVVQKRASMMTWAQVQEYRIRGSNAVDDPSQPDRPYMRWEELTDRYYGSRVIFIDPKSAGVHAAELLTRMDALAGTPQDHLVCKGYGISGNSQNTTGWARDAAEHGYRRWGYFYGSDIPHLAEYEARWDILGMDYSAGDSAWSAVRAFGKPVIGHVVPSTAAADAALAKGAAGVVASDASVHSGR